MCEETHQVPGDYFVCGLMTDLLFELTHYMQGRHLLPPQLCELSVE